VPFDATHTVVDRLNVTSWRRATAPRRADGTGDVVSLRRSPPPQQQSLIWRLVDPSPALRRRRPALTTRPSVRSLSVGHTVHPPRPLSPSQWHFWDAAAAVPRAENVPQFFATASVRRKLVDSIVGTRNNRAAYCGVHYWPCAVVPCCEIRPRPSTAADRRPTVIQNWPKTCFCEQAVYMR